jgi:hypothetical protein
MMECIPYDNYSYIIYIYRVSFLNRFLHGMHSVKLRFLWMMGSAQFFWWVIWPGRDKQCIDSKESLFEVCFGCGLIPITEYGFRPHGIQSWFGLIKMLGSYQIGLGLIF